MAKRAPSKTSFVPRIVFTTALSTTAVIPLCACGGQVAGVHPTGDDGGGIVYGVAARGFDGGHTHVAIDAFDASDDSYGSVAACAFDATSGGDCIGPSVASLGFDASRDTGVIFTVAAQGFDASTDASDDSPVFTVAVGAFDASTDAPVLGVALGGFDAASDAPVFGVAVGGFDASDDSGSRLRRPGKRG